MMKLNFEKNKFDNIQSLKELWVNSFGEKREAVDLFFNSCLNFTSVYTASVENKPVAMLCLIHSTLNGKKAHYLCSATTSVEYRNRGIMGRLIDFAVSDAVKNGDSYSLLFPASDSLYAYYERFGYKANCSAEKAVFKRTDLQRFCKDENGNLTAEKSYNYEELQRLTFKNNFLLQNNEFILFASRYYSLYDCKVIKSDNCFALVEENNGTAEVFYSIYTDFYLLAEKVLENTTAQRFVFTVKADNQLNNNSKTEKYGMIKSLDNSEKIPEDTYIGITLS